MTTKLPEREQREERRTRRSLDPITALHYQLASLRRRAALDALVLVDDAGCLVAGAGAWPACEELAAYAPPVTRELLSRVQPLYLSCRGGDTERAAMLERAATGVRRILEAA